MSYRFSNTSGVIGKHISLSTTGTSGLFNIQQCYEGMLTGDYPLPPPDYVGYNPRFHDASTNPGDAITKDMQSDQKNITIPSGIHPDGSSTSLTGFGFADMGGDLFDNFFGGFTVFTRDTSITIPFSTRNQSDGESNMTTEEFSGGGETFTVKHGYPDVGCFAFHLRNKFTRVPFQLVFGGAIGSDSASHNRHTTVDATLNSPSETTRMQIFQNSTASNFTQSEQFQICVIPIKASEYGTGTSTNQIITNLPTTFSSSRTEMDPQGFVTSAMTEGCTFYLTKGNHLTNTANYIAADLNRTS